MLSMDTYELLKECNFYVDKKLSDMIYRLADLNHHEGFVYYSQFGEIEFKEGPYQAILLDEVKIGTYTSNSHLGHVEVLAIVEGHRKPKILNWNFVVE